jgi:hypothetical protein
VREVLVQLVNGMYSPENPELFRPLYDSLLKGENGSSADRYFILKDFESYADAQRRIVAAYEDKKSWARLAILNTASAGKFSSDRTIEEYVRDIWHLQKVELPAVSSGRSSKAASRTTSVSKKSSVKKEKTEGAKKAVTTRKRTSPAKKASARS